MILKTRTKSRRRSRRANATRGLVPHVRKIVVAHDASAMCPVLLQEFTKKQKPILPQQEAELPVAPGFIPTCSEERKADHPKVETTRVMPHLGIVPECRFADKIVADDTSAFGHRVIAVRVNHVTHWGTMGSLADGFHSQIGPASGANFKLFMRRPNGGP